MAKDLKPRKRKLGLEIFLQPITLRFIKNSQSSNELNLCGFNVISTPASPLFLNPTEKNLAYRVKALI
jgi:hypothetical protein